MSYESSSAVCPQCGMRHVFLADEEPSTCDCGYDWGREAEEEEVPCLASKARQGGQAGFERS